MTSSPYVFDGHNDLAWAIRELGDASLGQIDLLRGDTRVQTDVPRLRSGGVGAQFWSVYVPATLTGGAAVKVTLEQIDLVRRMAARYPAAFLLALTAAQVEHAAAAGRVASLLGMEGGHSIDGSLGVLRMMHALGVRYLTLTHNLNVTWADSATDEPAQGGLSAFGRVVVEEMNDLGMFADLSHVSAATMHDALSASRAPVIFSHSSARALCDNPRNFPDDVLVRLTDNGGVCMVAFVPMFVSQPVSDWYVDCLDEVATAGGDRRDLAQVERVVTRRLVDAPPPASTVEHVADHVEHVRETAGVGHVGLGGDYDGAGFFPEKMPDVSSYPLLLDTLRERSWSEAELAGLAHGNVLRAMRAMESAACPAPSTRREPPDAAPGPGP